MWSAVQRAVVVASASEYQPYPPQPLRNANAAAAARAEASSHLKQGWTCDEDATIMTLVEQIGQKWSTISAALPGRTDDAVRNRYLRLQRKRKLAPGEIDND